MSIDVSLTGIEEVLAKLRKIEQMVPQLLEGAMLAELHVVREKSMERTPVDTGSLRASHTVKVERQWRDVVGIIGVGGSAAPYAVYVHEDLHKHHPVGQAKFLEQTLREEAMFLAQRIAARIDFSRGGM